MFGRLMNSAPNPGTQKALATVACKYMYPPLQPHKAWTERSSMTSARCF